MTGPVDRGALEAFVAVARAGTVREAAARLGRTQPSISARLAGLETAWGVRLFARRARGMTPTPEGARLLPLAGRALAALDEVDREAGRPVAPDEEVRVGAGDALGRVRLPSALRRLSAERPAVAVRVVEGPRERLLDALRLGEIDVALVSIPPEGTGPAPTGLDSEPVARSPVVLLVPAGEPVPARAVSVARLADRRVITLHPGSSFRRTIEAAFARAGTPFRPAVEVGSLSLVRRFVAAGLGVAPVPAIAFDGDDRASGVRAVGLAGFPAIAYRAFRRAGAPLPDAAVRLLGFLGSDGRRETRVRPGSR